MTTWINAQFNTGGYSNISNYMVIATFDLGNKLLENFANMLKMQDTYVLSL